jgi:nitroimidazol reductase NimA-like FMN-containing flavoprotein (pyridoxamine 5'-phosphate oxidase superfamily)
MTTDPYGQWMGTPMDEREIDDVLGSTGWGIITLADDDEPYSIPVSFGYDGEDVYFVFIRDSPTNTKFEFAEGGKTARLLVTDVQARFDWQSIAVTGTLREVPHDGDDWDELMAVLDEQAWFSSEFERAAGVEELVGWRLEPDQVRGLEVRPDRG